MLLSIHTELHRKFPCNFWIRKFNSMNEDLIPLPHFHWLFHWFHAISRVPFFSGKNVELLELSLKETLKVIRSQAMNAFIHQGRCPPLPQAL